MNTTAQILCGRAIALNAAITMDTNTISNNNTAYDGGTGRSDFGSYGFSGGSESGSRYRNPQPCSSLSIGLAGLLPFRKMVQ